MKGPQGRFSDPRLTPLQRTVLEALADAMATTGWPPTRRELAKATGRCLGSITVALATLVRLGYVEHRPRRDGWRPVVGALRRAREAGTLPRRAWLPSEDVVAEAVGKLIDEGRYPSRAAVAARVGCSLYALAQVRPGLVASGRWPDLPRNYPVLESRLRPIHESRRRAIHQGKVQQERTRLKPRGARAPGSPRTGRLLGLPDTPGPSPGI